MITLFKNDMVSQALQVQRQTGDKELFDKFIMKVMECKNATLLLDLTLSENEGYLLCDKLRKDKNPAGLSLVLVYLLQNSKFVDAAAFIDSIRENVNLDGPQEILHKFFKNMPKTTQQLTTMIDTKEMQGTNLLNNFLFFNKLNLFFNFRHKFR